MERPGEQRSQQSKVVYFVRHGLAEHNAALEQQEMTGEEVLQLYAQQFHDSRLSSWGLEEVTALRKVIAELEPMPELVISSPLSRTLATAVASFGALGLGPIEASELWRERMGRWPCERRRLQGVLQAEFPTVDFSSLTDEEDQLWGEEREPSGLAFRRAAEATADLLRRPQRALAVVSHAGFLGHHVFHPRNAALRVEPSSRLRAPFANCEIRRVELSAAEAGGAAAAALSWARPCGVLRDPEGQRRAAALQRGNMSRLNQLFTTPRGEELLRQHRKAFPAIFAADQGVLAPLPPQGARL